MPRGARIALLILLRGTLVLAALVLVVWTRAFTRWPSVYFMTGPSMEPTLRQEEYFTAAAPAAPLFRGMLVIFRYQDEDGVFHVLRRLAALPGDTIRMQDGRVIVNGQGQPWPFRIAQPAASHSELARTRDLYTWGPVTVPTDSVFLLADTRDIIGWPDSRFLGPIPISAIEARARHIVWSRERGRLLRALR